MKQLYEELKKDRDHVPVLCYILAIYLLSYLQYLNPKLNPKAYFRSWVKLEVYETKLKPCP